MTFLKWAGSKRQLVPKLLELLPPDVTNRRYVEPMVGGGALFFALQPKRAVLADLNTSLILAYHHVKCFPDELIGRLKVIGPATQYDNVRIAYNAAFKDGKLESNTQAARFIWLNHNCFNGLYRVNKSGEFNVPRGDRKELPADLFSTIVKASAALQTAELRITDLEDTFRTAKSEDFVYFDPPYLSLRHDGFTAYTKDDFDVGDHCKLRWVCGQLDKKGVPWMLSSSDHPLSRALYSDYDIHEVKARRSINSDGTGRGEVTELVIRNY